MRKFQKIMFMLTVGFAVLTFAGLGFLIFSSKDLTDTLFDCVILLISAASIAIAIFSQIAANRESHRLEKVLKNINAIDKNVESDIKTDEGVRRKLDKILALEEEIYHRVGGRKDVKKVEKGTPNSAEKPHGN